jgi:hypothetical protein
LQRFRGFGGVHVENDTTTAHVCQLVYCLGKVLILIDNSKGG